jgi:uncharacterized protein YvpB
LNNCGPAAALAVNQYWKTSTPLDQALLSRVLRQGAKYTQLDPLSAFLQTQGLRAPVISGSQLSDLYRFLDRGVPVIVLQRLAPKDSTPHFRVVVGYSRSQQRIWLSDSMFAKNSSIPMSSFDTLWNVQGRVMIPVSAR